eukprot:CAMPEP_0194118120 /NCGR_PEP_ID=MMETSP0150-20130528/34185_1 /TAXON_ID=122233 /ORGANISM="Chaetoceros debilis, Strain MM31A-1" /LENGTH=556 /DNA_ID=CAMNT_0038809399 /DNA_START=318 /DNA_END=1988 /DNA_ORIENTATION=-
MSSTTSSTLHKRNFNLLMSTSTPTSDSASSDIKMKEAPNKHLVVIIAGPTAVGKSAVASKICSQDVATGILKEHAKNNHDAHSPLLKSSTNSQIGKGHIISADSVQAYQGVEIGANKPTAEERAKTPHHLIDIVDSRSVCQYNAADWMRDSLLVLDQLKSRNGDEDAEVNDGIDTDNVTINNEVDENTRERTERIRNFLAKFQKGKEAKNEILPVVVGGTMMYLQWLVHGKPDAMKPSEEAIQRAASIVAKFETQNEGDGDDDGSTDENSGWDAAVQHTTSLGPLFGERVAKLPGKDWYRLRRILEVAYTVLDDDDKEAKIKQLYNGQREGGLDESMEYDVRCFFLCPDERMTHCAVVDSRCEQMIGGGLLKETTELHTTGQLPEEGQQARAIGYRQTLDYLKREENEENDDEAFSAYLHEFTGATRRYAKKQMQWFRRDSKFLFVPVKLGEEKIDRVDQVAAIIREMCIKPRDKFDKELWPSDTHKEKKTKIDETSAQNQPLSERTKQVNEQQGKSMKFFQTKRHHLIEGSEEYKVVMKEADECTALLCSLKASS